MAVLLPGPALLFCPADRPERFAKAAARSDGVILDLEDAVLPGSKDQARQHLAAAFEGPEPLASETTLVRINGQASGHQDHDVAALAGTGLRWAVVPKVEDPAELDRLAHHLPGTGLIPQIETPRGVLEAARLAEHPAVVGILWGTEDLAAGLGGAGARDEDGALLPAISHVRHQLLLTAAAYGIPAIDTIFTALESPARMQQEAAEAAAAGFACKACIHPQQAAAVREAYAPTPAQLERAEELLAEFARHAGCGA
ncbi:CoA ester lyase [Nesterenkonia pannonica]|uniref:HpcH/HpaI aldolase/citrate lyase family protein n=1 Tax=Nesterenkonia pannonica TaxID=1548602 RepID=UPI0021646FE0|nr:CoA ester lyase [Nesterenkonia pannonica]